MTKQWLLACGCLLASLYSTAQQYIPTDEGSEVKFSIHNFGVAVSGTLKGLSGFIRFEPKDMARDTFNIELDAKTVNTGLEMRDNHLKTEEYLFTDKYSTISFKSTKVTAATKEGWLFVFGQLTMRGVTKEVSFPFQPLLTTDNKYLFTGEFKINRKDFGVGGSSISMSNEVTVYLKVLAAPAKAVTVAIPPVQQ